MTFHKDISEEELVHLLRRGDESAFVYIYEQYWQSLFNHAYKRLPKEAVVQELVQDLFTDVWQYRNKLQIHSSLRGYLHQSMKFKVLNRIKSDIVREKYVQAKLVESHIASNVVEDVLQYKELENALKKEIEHLPPQPKTVYQMKHNNGLSYQEIAQNLKISVSTVEKHMIKALKIIRKNLKEYAVGSLILFTIHNFF